MWYNNIKNLYYCMIKIENQNFKSSYVVDYVPEKRGLVQRHVEWLKQDCSIAKRALKISLIALEVLLLSSTIIGLKIVADAFELSKRLTSEKRFHAQVPLKKRPGETEEISLKSHKRTFNHINEFAIEDNTIWFRHKGHRAWQPLYFDGFANGRTPQAIDCDGANLVVLDNENVLHYKKIFKEFRAEELNIQSNRHFQGVSNFKVQPGDSFSVDKSSKNNWKKQWFVLPYVHHLVNIFSGKQLKLPPFIRSFAISHRGRYNNFTEDGAGQRHHVSVGVTTLYVLSQNGRDIYKYDPWSPKCAKVSIPLPETQHTTFEAKKIAASGSMLMAVGYESQSTTTEKTLKILTKLSDIDTEGGNPLLKYDFSKHKNDPDVRVLPVEPSWREHPLNLRGAAAVSDEITVLQTGEGNQARELRIGGKNEHGHVGYYRKRVVDSHWEFIKTHDQIDRTVSFLPNQSSLAPSEKFETTVHDYQGELAAKVEKISRATLRNFGDRSSLAHLDLQIAGMTYSLPIYKRITLRNYLGFKGSRYDLVIPDMFANIPQLKGVFGDKKVHPLNVKVKGNMATLSSSKWHFYTEAVSAF